MLTGSKKFLVLLSVYPSVCIIRCCKTCASSLLFIFAWVISQQSLLVLGYHCSVLLCNLWNSYVQHSLAAAVSNRAVLGFRWSEWEGQGWEVLHVYSEFTQDQQINSGSAIAASVQVHTDTYTQVHTHSCFHLSLLFSVELFWTKFPSCHQL